MTEFIITGRAAGKTHEILEKMLAEDDLYYLGHNAAAADWAFRRCLELADAKDIPLDEDQIRALRSRFLRYSEPGSPRRRRVAVDNVELLLANILGNAEVVTVTGTGTVTTIRPINTEVCTHD